MTGFQKAQLFTPAEAAARRKLFARFATRDAVDAEIDRLIALGDKAESRRDRAEWESPAYWRHHDVAMGYYERARQLMPPGS